MDFLGRSIDNTHIGNTEILKGLAGGEEGDLLVEGDLVVGGDVAFNSLSIDGYSLPETTGTAEGQVITLNADLKTSEWKNVGGTGIAGVNQVLYKMNERNFYPTDNTYHTLVDTSSAYGSNIITWADINENGAVELNAEGYFSVGTTGDQVQFEFFVGLNNNVSGTFRYQSQVISLQKTAFAGQAPEESADDYDNRVAWKWRLKFLIQRRGATLFSQFQSGEVQWRNGSGNLGSRALEFENATPPAVKLPGYATNDVGGYWQNLPPTSGFVLSGKTINIGSTTRIVPTKYEITYFNPSTEILTSTSAPATDHLTLANLNAGPFGDGGHVNSFLVNGLKPMTGNLNLSNNNIINANEITKTTPSGGNFEIKNNDGPLVLSAQGGLSNIQLVTTNNVIANCNLFESLAAVNLFNANIVMNGNQIQNTTLVSSNTALECLATADLRLVGDIVDIVSTNTINQTIGPTTKMTIDSLETTTFNDINMDNNDLKNALNIIDQSTQNNINMADTGFLNGINISSNGNAIIVQELSSGNNIGITSGSAGMVALSGPLNIRNEDAANDLQIAKDNGGNIVLDNSGGGVVLVENSNLDMNNNGIVNVSSINGLTPVGGLSSGTSNSAILTASTAEQSILANTFVGSRQSPANTFKQGDAYTATLAGNFSSNNADTLTLKLKGGAAGTNVLSSIVVPLNGSSGVFFELEINFVIRQIGTAGVADLAINYDFSYNQSAGGNFQGERKCEVNNSTFDTTILNQLDITAQFSSTSANNSIETLLSTLGKTY